jgi:hypothetical protein
MSAYLHQLHCEHVERRRRWFTPPPIKIEPKPLMLPSPPAPSAAALQVMPARLIGGCKPSPGHILRTVAARFGVTVADLLGGCRSHYIVRPRQLVAWLGRRVRGDSKSRIGRWLGGRDHTTIINAERRVNDLMRDNPWWAATVEDLVRELSPSVINDGEVGEANCRRFRASTK